MSVPSFGIGLELDLLCSLPALDCSILCTYYSVSFIAEQMPALSVVEETHSHKLGSHKQARMRAPSSLPNVGHFLASTSTSESTSTSVS